MTKNIEETFAWMKVSKNIFKIIANQNIMDVINEISIMLNYLFEYENEQGYIMECKIHNE